MAWSQPFAGIRWAEMSDENLNLGGDFMGILSKLKRAVGLTSEHHHHRRTKKKKRTPPRKANGEFRKRKKRR